MKTEHRMIFGWDEKAILLKGLKNGYLEPHDLHKLNKLQSGGGQKTTEEMQEELFGLIAKIYDDERGDFLKRLCKEWGIPEPITIKAIDKREQVDVE